MKHLKMLGLAAIAALGLMAFVGAGTASATKLCTDSACNTVYPKGTTIHSTLKTGTSATLSETGGGVIATCTGSTVKGKTTAESGSPLSGSIETLTWEGCNQTTDTVKLGSLSIEKVGTEDKGTVVGKGSEVTLSIFGVSCTYGTGEGTPLGTITGGEAPVLSINAGVAKTAGGFLCPGSGTWKAEYIVTEPHAVHIG